MYYTSRTTEKGVALIQLVCPLCGQNAKFKLFKHEKFTFVFIIPWWSTKNYATCGNCFNTFEVKKEEMREIERALRNSELIMKGYCPNCRRKLRNSQNFCVSCGYRLE